jgi:hypothetical protein
MLRARPSHTPWRAHTNTYRVKSGYNDGSLPYAAVSHPSATSCTCGCNAFLRQSTLTHPQSYYNRTAYFMNIYWSHCLKNLRNSLSWMDTISGSRFVALSENVAFFFYVKYMPCLQVFYGIIYVMNTPWLWAVLCHHTYDRCRTKFVKVEWVPPFSHPPVWKWSGGFCSVVKDCVCSVFRYVRLV